MDAENQVNHLKKLIEENEKALREIKSIVADLEGRRCSSVEAIEKASRAMDIRPARLLLIQPTKKFPPYPSCSP